MALSVLPICHPKSDNVICHYVMMHYFYRIFRCTDAADVLILIINEPV